MFVSAHTTTLRIITTALNQDTDSSQSSALLNHKHLTCLTKATSTISLVPGSISICILDLLDGRHLALHKTWDIVDLVNVLDLLDFHGLLHGLHCGTLSLLQLESSRCQLKWSPLLQLNAVTSSSLSMSWTCRGHLVLRHHGNELRPRYLSSVPVASRFFMSCLSESSTY